MMLAALLRRQFGRHRGPTVLLAVFVLIVAGLLTLWPRAILSMHTASLQHGLAQLGPGDRALVGSWAEPRLPERTAAFSPESFQSQLDAYRDQLPPELRDATGDPAWTAAATGVPVVSGLPDRVRSLTLDLTLAPSAAGALEVVDGRLPAEPRRGDDAAPVEVMLPATAAETAQWAIGEERLVPQAPQVFGETGERPPQRPLVLAGTYRPADPGAVLWSLDTALAEPALAFDPDLGWDVDTGALVHPDVLLRPFATANASVTVRQWMPLDASRVHTGNAAALEQQLRGLGAAPMALESDAGRHLIPFTSRAQDAVSEATRITATTQQALALLASGPLGVSLAAAALAVRLVLGRRRTALALVASRGASGPQLRAILALEGLAYGLPAAALGAAAAVVLVPSTVPGTLIGPGQLWLPLAAGLTPAALFCLTHIPTGLRHGDDGDGTGPSARLRAALEGLVVLAAAAAVVLLYQRGASGPTGAGDDAGAAAGLGVDPLLAATPLLLGLALTVVVLRLYPVVLRRWAVRGRASTGLIGFLGPERGLRAPGATVVPLLALVVGVSVLVFSGLLLATVRDGIAETARAEVGADVKYRGTPLDPDQVRALRGIEGVQALAVVSDVGARAVDLPGARRNYRFLAADTRALAEVQAGFPGAIGAERLSRLFPDGTVGGVDDAGTAGAEGASVEDADLATRPVPVLLSDRFDGALSGEGTVRFDRYYPAVLVGTGPQDAGIVPAVDWAMVDVANYNAVRGSQTRPSIVYFRLDPAADRAEVLAAIRDAVPGSSVLATPDGEAARILDQPAVKGLSAGLWAIVGVVALLALLTLVLTALVTGPARNQLVALLRTLGMPATQDPRLVLWELVPPSLAALASGAVGGAALTAVVLPRLDLQGYTRGAGPPALSVDPWLMLGFLGLFAVVLGASLAAALWAARRQQLATVLRIGQE
ncbi:FtsX-like permease family protein [Zafaria sp. Z1313]|uniref:FtsX-like permease family protein n=1 Tax=Zafaria sp. Z1313 TaxID=3423202 RepID=UPI003D302FAA